MGYTDKEILVTNVYDRLEQATTRIKVLQGGTRSSKTYSTCQYYILKLLNESGKVLTICRKTTPSLKLTVLRDFIEILSNMDIFDEKDFNKSDNTYILNGNLVEFISLDQPQKKRGAKRNYLWLNESNEFTWEDFVQLNIRTSEEIILDFNPSEYFWVFDKIIPRIDCTLIKSTYRDNPFLSKEQISEIELLKITDPDYYTVYGTGELAIVKGVIFKNWEVIDESKFPDDEDCKWVTYGMDFGFSVDPTTIIKVALSSGEIYLKELVYQKGLTNSDICQKLKEFNIGNTDLIIADSAEPKSIQDIINSGYLIKGVKKFAGSVNYGLDKMKSYKLNVTSESENLIHELKTYKWETDKNGHTINKPHGIDHAIDAIRYVIQTNSDSRSRVVKIPTRTVKPTEAEHYSNIEKGFGGDSFDRWVGAFGP